MKVPPGVSPQDFSDALKQFEDIVGKDWVFTSDQDVAMYRDAYSPFYGEEDELVASAAVAPDNVEDVQKIVKVANTYKIPIYAISTGKNLGYGGSAPAYSGSVVLDLKRIAAHHVPVPGPLQIGDHGLIPIRRRRLGRQASRRKEGGCSDRRENWSCQGRFRTRSDSFAIGGVPPVVTRGRRSC